MCGGSPQEACVGLDWGEESRVGSPTACAPGVVPGVAPGVRAGLGVRARLQRTASRLNSEHMRTGGER